MSSDKTKDVIEKANEDFEKSKEPSRNYSLADKSDILTPDEEREKYKKIAELMGISQQQEEIDALKQGFTITQQGIQALTAELQNTNNVVNQLTEIIKKTSTQSPTLNNKNEEKILQFADIADKLADAYAKIKGKPAEDSFLVDYKTELQNQAKMGLEISDLIQKNVKKKLVNEVVNDTISLIGKSPEHGP